MRDVSRGVTVTVKFGISRSVVGVRHVESARRVGSSTIRNRCRCASIFFALVLPIVCPINGWRVLLQVRPNRSTGRTLSGMVSSLSTYIGNALLTWPRLL